MEEKNTNSFPIYKLKKIVALALIVMVIISIVFCLIIYFDHSKMTIVDDLNAQETEKIKYSLDSIEYGRYLTIEGWALIPEEATQKILCYVLLKNKETEEYYRLPTQMNKREDLNEMFLDGIDYSNRGFISKVKLDIPELEYNMYEIYLYYEDDANGYLVNTNTLLKKIPEGN